MLIFPQRPYGGYLKPHEEQIRRLASEGLNPPDIARVLFAQGVRSPWELANGLDDEAQIRTFSGLIYHILRLRKRRFDKLKLKKRIARAKQKLRDVEQLLALVEREEKSAKGRKRKERRGRNDETRYRAFMPQPDRHA